MSCQDAGAISARSGRRPGQPPRPAPCSSVPHSVLSTLVTHCAPLIRGEDDDFSSPRTWTPPLLVSIKGGGGHHLLHDLIIHTHVTRRTHTRSLEPRYWHLPQSPPLAETWELPSLSRLACTPYYKHSGCKIIQCPRTPPLCWTYGPAAGTRINPCVIVLPLASTSRTRKHAAFTSWDPNPRVGTPTVGAPGRGAA